MNILAAKFRSLTSRARPDDDRPRYNGDLVPPDQRHELDITSQHGEATVLFSLLEADDPHFAVEVGAHDGISISNSYPFLQQPGWSGVLVEPVPALFGKLDALYAENPNVTCFNKALTDRAGRGRLYIGQDGGELGYNATLCEDDYFGRYRSDDTIEVELDTLTNVLTAAQAPQDISILSVDAEGMDYEVFCGLDLERFRPRLIVTENYTSESQTRAGETTGDRLLRHGYDLHDKVGGNTIWVRRTRSKNER